MRVTVQIEGREICHRISCPVRRHLTSTYKAPKTLGHFHVDQMGRMEFVVTTKKARLDARAERCLQQELQQRRGVEDDHTRTRAPPG